MSTANWILLAFAAACVANGVGLVLLAKIVMHLDLRLQVAYKIMGITWEEPS